MNALQRGYKAGRDLLAPALNPFPEGSIEHAHWEMKWREGAAHTLAEKDAERRARGPALDCLYRRGEKCHCGQRGLCLEAA